MSCIQATSVGKPCVTLPNRSQLQRVPGTTHGTLLKLTYKQCAPRLKSWQGSTVVCLFGDKDKSEDTKSPWDAFGKAMGNLGNFTKGQSVEGMLRQQMEKKEYFDGSGGKSPPRGGGGGGGGGGGDGSGDSEDEGWGGIIDETAQVILATLGIIFVYMYILTGEELTLLARDYLKYLFGRGYKSVRLTNAMEWWESFLENFKPEESYDDKYWLEKAIINTPTWYDNPEKYRRLLEAYMESQEEEEDDDDNDNDNDNDDGL
ncbi:uncharacterized protein LOC116116250 [Pistacia vera]|uniref:uncharacterized protein LOC116116250 n=1 Tax=Pistacia vera TaxID=55513 RepID=UPI001263E2E9|nr:uncharacterized protein LOC116116250 [Pistacia vera]